MSSKKYRKRLKKRHLCNNAVKKVVSVAYRTTSALKQLGEAAASATISANNFKKTHHEYSVNNNEHPGTL